MTELEVGIQINIYIYILPLISAEGRIDATYQSLWELPYAMALTRPPSTKEKCPYY